MQTHFWSDHIDSPRMREKCLEVDKFTKLKMEECIFEQFRRCNEFEIETNYMFFIKFSSIFSIFYKLNFVAFLLIFTLKYLVSEHLKN